MRFGLLAAVISSAAMAQQQGVWTGYVNGWQPSGQQANGTWVGNTRFPTTQPVQPRTTYPTYPNWVWQQNAAAQVYLAQQQAREQARADADARARADAAAQAAMQAELAREQQRAEDARAALAQQQWAAQQEQLKLQTQLLEQERERVEAERRALAEAEQQRTQQRDAEAKLEAERETLRRALARAEEDAKPREKGPDIHKWVDADGVVHFSTRPPEQR